MCINMCVDMYAESIQILYVHNHVYWNVRRHLYRPAGVDMCRDIYVKNMHKHFYRHVHKTCL